MLGKLEIRNISSLQDVKVEIWSVDKKTKYSLEVISRKGTVRYLLPDKITRLIISYDESIFWEGIVPITVSPIIIDPKQKIVLYQGDRLVNLHRAQSFKIEWLILIVLLLFIASYLYYVRQ